MKINTFRNLHTDPITVTIKTCIKEASFEWSLTKGILKMLQKLHFANGKQILHSSNDEGSLNQLFFKPKDQ